MAGFAAAYQLATRAAETLPARHARVVSVADRLPEVLLAGSPQVAPLLLRRRWARSSRSPSAHADTLLDTLAALLRHDGSPTHAAEELYCHRNTVIYRIKQIEQLTGRSLADPRDKMLLEPGPARPGRTYRPSPAGRSRCGQARAQAAAPNHRAGLLDGALRGGGVADPCRRSRG